MLFGGGRDRLPPHPRSGHIPDLLYHYLKRNLHIATKQEIADSGDWTEIRGQPITRPYQLNRPLLAISFSFWTESNGPTNQLDDPICNTLKIEKWRCSHKSRIHVPAWTWGTTCPTGQVTSRSIAWEDAQRSIVLLNTFSTCFVCLLICPLA